MALRVMSGIRVPVISQIVSLAIKKGVVDMSPFVRKAAALAIPKCYDLDPNTEPQLLEYISTLLGDRQYFVAGPAVTAFLHVCPERIDLIHKHYRALVRKVVDMDEWSQVATLRLLVHYSRRCFPRRTQRIRPSKETGFYDDEEKAADDEEDAEPVHEIIKIDPDLDAFLKACRTLLSSRNSAVIIAAVRCLIYLGTPTDTDSAIGPLIGLLRGSKDIQLVAMYNIVVVCLTQPTCFVRFASHFLVKFVDTFEICRLKFEVLALIYPYCESYISELILAELEHFAHSNDPPLVQESVRAIGRCAQTNDVASKRCLSLLLHQVSTQDGQVVAEALSVIRLLIQKDAQQHVSTVIKLAKNLDTMTDSGARATVIWLVSEYAGLPDDQNVAPDVLRILASGFADESEIAKLQILLLAAKVYLYHLLRAAPSLARDKLTDSSEGEPRDHETRMPNDADDGWSEKTQQAIPQGNDRSNTIKLLWEYILHLTRYDTSYDLRDRARLYEALLANPSSTQLASLVLLAPKPVPHTPSPSENRKGHLLGSSSLVVGSKGIIGCEELPDWVKEGEEPDPELRQEPNTGGQSSPKMKSAAAELDRAVEEKGLASMEAPGKGKSLDDWLNEESVEEVAEESGETDEEVSSSEYEEVTASESEDEPEGERAPLVQ